MPILFLGDGRVDIDRIRLTGKLVPVLFRADGGVGMDRIRYGRRTFNLCLGGGAGSMQITSTWSIMTSAVN